MLVQQLSFLTLTLAVFATACAAPPGGTTATQPDRPTAPKLLTIAQDFEPPDIEGFASGVRPAGSGQIREILHNRLARKVREGVIQPELAVEIPSVENGSWRVNPDGSMDITWRLRPGVRWQDGTPFTSGDMLFAFDVYKNPALPPMATAGTFRLMSAATAPDDATLIVHWTQIDVTAPEAAGFTPLPRHLLEDAYKGDKDAFVNSSRFRSDFVGLGPYRLVNWELGSFMEMARFDDYYGGRPPFDTVVVRFIQDANAMVANLLSGAVDVAVRPQMDLSTALELKQRWEQAGNQAWIEPSGRVHYGEAQRRAEVARPRNGLTNPLVRRAFLQATDRQGLAELFTQGFAPLADSYVAPDDPLRAQVESVISRYPYDLTAAARLMAEAGWTRGPDGVLMHNETGDRFEGEVWGSPELTNREEPTVLADQWNALGTRLTPYIIPVARINDRELAANSPLFTVSGGQAATTWYTPDRLHSRFVAGPANAWGGRNKFGYANPQVDDLLDRLQATIDNRARTDLHRQLLEEESRDVAFFPLFWEVVPVFAARGVKPSPNQPLSLGQFVAWTRD
jgi:peptide/nickel transport system substrate-binding protein